MGRKKDSLFAFHLRGHHRISRNNKFVDTRASANEVIGMPAIAIVHIPFYFLSPHLYFGMMTYAVLFITIHTVLHRFTWLGEKVFWWHWNHHMRNQNKSYNVVLPIADAILGTLEGRLPPEQPDLEGEAPPEPPALEGELPPEPLP